MKLHFIELLSRKNSTTYKKPAVVALILMILIVIPLFYIKPVNYYLFLLESPFSYSNGVKNSPEPPSSNSNGVKNSSEAPPSFSTGIKKELPKKNCDIFSGEWIPNPNAPYYTNSTCLAIDDRQNCMKYGRPDSGFLHWRWKPDACELPIFNPYDFLQLMRDKSLAFIGDSLSRNQMQSLICLLSRVEYPKDVTSTYDYGFKRFNYTTFNFTMAVLWSPYLIKANKGKGDSNGPTHLYLDEYDQKWTTQIDDFDYLIISAGIWFFSPDIFHENKQIVGCHNCLLDNVTNLGMYYGYRKAFKTAFRAINSSKKFKGMTILWTFSPAHFENGEWDKGGDCVIKKPFRRNETELKDWNLELHKIQIEEFRVAKKEGRKRGIKYRLLDITQAMLMRPDGHPSRYWHENLTLPNDCTHWCLPGPIDSLNEFLLEILKRGEDHII